MTARSRSPAPSRARWATGRWPPRFARAGSAGPEWRAGGERPLPLPCPIAGPGRSRPAEPTCHSRSAWSGNYHHSRRCRQCDTDRSRGQGPARFLHAGSRAFLAPWHPPGGHNQHAVAFHSFRPVQPRTAQRGPKLWSKGMLAPRSSCLGGGNPVLRAGQIPLGARHGIRGYVGRSGLAANGTARLRGVTAASGSVSVAAKGGGLPCQGPRDGAFEALFMRPAY